MSKYAKFFPEKNTLEVARYLVGQGISVMPIEPRGKRPFFTKLPKGEDGRPHWEIFQTRYPTDDELVAWFGSGDANIGLVCGKISGIVTIDVDGDVGGGAGDQWFRQNAPNPACYQTTSNPRRYHAFYAHPGRKVPSVNGEIAPHVDIKADGGYVVFCPSIHENGAQYTFYALPDIFKDFTDLPPLPDTVLKWLAARDQKQNPAPQNPAVIAMPTTTSGGTSPYGRAVLDGQCAAVQECLEGNRNDRLNVAAFRVGRFVGGGEADEQEARQALLDAATAAGLPFNEAVATINSGMTKGRLSPAAPKENGTSARETNIPSQLNEWPEIVPLDNGVLPNMAAIYAQSKAAGHPLMPPVIGDYCEGLAAELEVPFELCWAMSMAALATAAQNRFYIKVWDGYKEQLSLYLLCALDPANRKSAVVSRCSAPLYAWEDHMQEVEGDTIRKLRSERQTMERVIEKMRKRAADAEDPAQRRELQAQIDELEAELPPVPSYPRLLADDVTPEALASILPSCHESIGLLSAEGGIFSTFGGRYSQGMPNLDLLLKAFSGEPYRVDRKGAEPTLLSAPKVTLGLSVQPQVLLDNQKTAATFRGRGLYGRFLYLIPQSPVGYRKNLHTAMNPALENAFRAIVESLLPERWVAENQQLEQLVFDEAALAERQTFANDIETELRETGELGGLSDWGGKIVGTMARIAGLYHLTSGEQDGIIKAHCVRQAVLTCGFLIEHAKQAYDLMGADPQLEGAKKILAWMLHKGELQFDKQSLWQGTKRTFKTAAELNTSLEILTERGFLRCIKREGSQKCVCEVNPQVFKGAA